jgi:hypothetical protein
LIACCTLIRYDAWFLLPFVAGFFLLFGGENRWRSTVAFCLVAAIGPLYWLAHNAIMFSDPLEFYNGEWSAKGIYQRALDQGGFRYPGDHDWRKAWQYYRAAAELASPPAVVARRSGRGRDRRAWWAVALLALTPAFYVLSMYSSGTPIFVPTLWPNSYYNTRYGLNALPLACFGIAALASLLPVRWRVVPAVLLVIAAVTPWIGYPRKENWVTWRESEQTSRPPHGRSCRGLSAALPPRHGIFTASAIRAASARVRHSVARVVSPGRRPAVAGHLRAPRSFSLGRVGHRAARRRRLQNPAAHDARPAPL